MSGVVVPGEVVWTPPADVLDHTEIGRFVRWLRDHRGLDLPTHDLLWKWSVDDLDGFWSAVWDFFDVGERPGPVLARRTMPGAVWFPEASINYARHALRWTRDEERVVVQGRSQTRPDLDLSGAELWDQVARAQAVLSGLGVGRGDRVAGYLPNVPEALVAFLATVSLGAVWASCASELGVRSVVDRFAQIEPTVLIAAGGYQYGSKAIDRTAQVAEIRSQLPGVRVVLDIGYGPWRIPDTEVLTAALDAARRGNRASRTFRSTTRWSCCSPPAPPDRRRRSCTVTAASCSSTSRTMRCPGTWRPATASSGTRRPPG